jgi:peroxiredoxin
MRRGLLRAAAAASILACLMTAVYGRGSEVTAEQRVLDYVRAHVEPGQPLEVSDLYNRVFTTPDERRALDKLYRAFFRVPLFVAQYQQQNGRPPSLKVIAGQFDLPSAQAAGVLVRVMECDPRVPRFFTRDPKTHEITRVDVAAIESDPRFGQVLHRQLSGWEGQRAPDFTLPRLGGGEIRLAHPADNVVLLYVWFTGCPPCLKETPALVDLQKEFGSRGLRVVGANADQLLGLSYDDAFRERYARERQINFPLGAWTRDADTALGNIAIFPNLFLMGRDGIIIHHWVGYTAPADLRQALRAALRRAPMRP